MNSFEQAGFEIIVHSSASKPMGITELVNKNNIYSLNMFYWSFAFLAISDHDLLNSYSLPLITLKKYEYHAMFLPLLGLRAPNVALLLPFVALEGRNRARTGPAGGTLIALR